MPASAYGTRSTHCATLGLRTVRTIDELNAAYRPLILQWHPDRHYGLASEAIALVRATAINEAYAFLLAALEGDGGGNVARAVPRDGFPDASVLEIFVQPSAVISVGYNHSTAELFVKFLGNRIYRYDGVPATVVEALLSAPSASAFVAEHIDRTFNSEALKRTT